MRRVAAVALLLVGLTGCGGSAEPRQTVEELRWAERASFAVDGLDQALQNVVNAGVDARTLTQTSNLFEALVGYTYLGGCRELLAKAGPAGPRWRSLSVELDAACGEFVRASRLFTRAVRNEDPVLLAAAARTALVKQGVVERAAVELARPAPSRATAGA